MSDNWVAVYDVEDACWIVKPSADIETWIYLHDAVIAQRIVAAVNACRDIPTVVLQQGVIWKLEVTGQSSVYIHGACASEPWFDPRAIASKGLTSGSQQANTSDGESVAGEVS